MGSDANRLRKKWQDYSGKNAGIAEHNFFETFLNLFDGTEYKVERSPKAFRELYVNVELSVQEAGEVYKPTKAVTRHGVVPDYSITNTETNKTMYVEVKRQDGWVDGGKRSDGRGNAHERSCKFFTPGLQKTLRNQGNLDDGVIPIWVVFTGDITRDPCRVREIKHWYDGIPGHYFMWRNRAISEPLIDHFINHIKPLID
jgi:hypothetical protein